MKTKTKVSQNNRRIVKNTVMLYFRMLLIMAVTLYTSRVILKTLGVEDFGIYNVVAGVISMLVLIRGVMAAGTSRYLNFSLGKGDIEMARKTFNVSYVIYVVICIILIILAESIGVWFLNTKLIIPETRTIAANWVFQFTILSAVNQMMATPFNAVIIAHERMNVYAYISVLEAAIKLGVSFAIVISPIDNLIFYGALMLLSDLMIRSVYRLYCRKQFEECKFKFYKDKAFYKEILSYSGWNLFGSLAGFARSQGLNVLINMFFAPSVCAARGIAYQVNNAITQFTHNFYTAVKPQITKYYAQGDLKNMKLLVFRSSKMSFFLMLLLSLPIVIEAPYIIGLWLGQLPDYVVIFVRLIILFSTIEAMAHPLMTVCHATGKIAVYQVVVGTMQIFILPISYLLLENGQEPPCVFVVAIVIAIICLFTRLWIVKWLVDFPFWEYTFHVIVNAILVTVVSSILPIVIYRSMSDDIVDVGIVCISTLLSTVATIYLIGLNTAEKRFVTKAITKILHIKIK